MNPDFLRGILLKVSFKGEPFRRAQAFLVNVALEGEPFTADVLPKELAPDNSTSGCAVGALSRIGILECVGRTQSPSKPRHGAEVKVWRLCPGKHATAQAWLKANGFEVPASKQGELL